MLEMNWHWNPIIWWQWIYFAFWHFDGNYAKHFFCGSWKGSWTTTKECAEVYISLNLHNNDIRKTNKMMRWEHFRIQLTLIAIAAFDNQCHGAFVIKAFGPFWSEGGSAKYCTFITLETLSSSSSWLESLLVVSIML